MRLPFLGLELSFGRQATAPPEEKVSATSPLIYLMHQGQSATGVWTKRNFAQYSDDAYKRCVVAFKCINEISRNAGKIPLRVFVGDREAPPNHPLVKLLAKPNPWQPHAAFFEAFMAYYLLSGNTYVEGVGPNDNKPPLELWPLRPDRMRVIPGPMGPTGYLYTVNGDKKTWDVDPVAGTSPILHLRTFNPLDDWYGMSPVEAAAYAVDAHNMAGEWNQGLLQNGARPSGALVYKPDAGQPNNLSEKQFLALKEQLNAAYSGTRNAGRPMILEGGLDWKAMSLTPAEMDWLAGKNNSAREICMAFGVPPQTLGIPGDNTYSNMAEARQAFYQDCIIPTFQSLIDGLNGWLCPRYGEGVTIVMHTEDLPALALVREKRWNAVQSSTWMTVNEKRKATGMEPLPQAEADEVFISSSMTPLTGATEPPEGDETLPGDDGAGGEDDEARQATTVEEGQVQQTALNGAQITALISIATSVNSGDLSVEAAEALIRISFPAVADQAIATLASALEAMGKNPKPASTGEPQAKPNAKPPAKPTKSLDELFAAASKAAERLDRAKA